MKIKEVWIVARDVAYEGQDVCSAHLTENGAEKEAYRLCEERNVKEGFDLKEPYKNNFQNAQRGGYFDAYMSDIAFWFFPVEVKD